MTTNSPSLNINEASKACGLSPSVLRIWELRYGWPSPKRKPNGYRTYNQHQVQELGRMAELVKSGTPISSLIVDALPRWPTDQSQPAKVHRLTSSRSVARPQDRNEAAMQQELLDAVETRRGSSVKELLQRCIWSIRPADEAQCALVPTLVGVAEMHQAGREIKEAGEIGELIKQRCLQLLRQYKPSDDEIWVVPAKAEDQPLATLAALVINQRGQHARPWLETAAPPSGSLLIAGIEDDRHGIRQDRIVGRVAALSDGTTIGLADLLNEAAPLPWLVHAA